MLRRNVAQKCSRREISLGKWPAHILGGWVPRWDFYTDGRKKKMKKMERVAAGGGSAKKKNTERSIEPPSGKANWLMVRAPHLKQRDAEWSATTGTTKVVGGAMADGRESGAPEGPIPEHEPPPVFCLLFSLSRQAPASGDSGDLGQKGGTAWGGWDAGRARGTSTLVLRPRSPPRRRRRRRLELSLSFFFFPWRV